MNYFLPYLWQLVTIHFYSFNPLLPTTHKSAWIDKISILKLEGIIKKFPMSVATMSR